MTDIGGIGVTVVVDSCQILNNKTSAYSKLFISCILCSCFGDGYH